QTIIKFQEEELNYGSFYAQWLKCKFLTEKNLQTSSDPWSQKIGSSLLRSIERRTSKLLANESFNACLFLDPRFSHKLTANKRSDAITYLKKLYEKLKETGSIKCDRVNSFPNTSTTLDVEDFDDGDQYVNDYLSQNLEDTNEDSIDVYSKIENLKLPFQKVNTNVLEFWREREFADPELYLLSTICFAIPPTQ
ncbi:uncharacterized protein LOC118732381, partial [Rhagoletis pomonella]|uniref:uncharacterized protein LOC118732381 n=1 Tax=Rhagoletis pomonella TaxID=28610 RepID=UPI0017823489